MNRVFYSLLATSFALVLATAQPAAATVDPANEMVVLHVEGAPFERGQVIDGSSLLKLKSGWSVTLANSKGTFITVKGPSETVPLRTESAQPGNPMIIQTLGALLRAEKDSTAVLGVVRSASRSADVSPPVAWAASVERSGTSCVQSDVALLWRRDFQRAVKLSIRPSNSARVAQVVWPAGQAFLSMDSASFRDGESYIFSLEGRSVELKIRLMPANLTRQVEQAVWLSSAGCNSQAVALIETIR